jgi:hypothetical protein
MFIYRYALSTLLLFPKKIQLISEVYVMYINRFIKES